MSNNKSTTAPDSTVAFPGGSIGQTWTHTQLVKISVEHTWTIDHFYYYLNGPNVTEPHFNELSSTTFYPHRHDDTPGFLLTICPNGEDEESQDYVSLFLSCFTTGTSEVLVNFQLSIVNREGNHVNGHRGSYKYTRNVGNGWPRFIERAHLLASKADLLPNGQLRIHCKVTAWYNRFETSGVYIRPTTLMDHERRFSLDMKKLFGSNQHSDVIIIVDGAEVPAHRSILAVRSPVFGAMFDHGDTKEAKEGKVIIEDTDLDTFRSMLLYLYSGEIPHPEQLTEALLVAADKYQIIGLKLACEDYLSTLLTIETVATALVFADTHSAAKMKSNCLQFITNNATQVMLTTSWRTMIKTRPDLLEGLFISALKTRGQVA